MKLLYDPGEGMDFWNAIEKLPGYPAGERQPIRVMRFESDALHRVDETLAAVGARRDRPLLLVMDAVPMRRGADSLKLLLEGTLQAAGWQTG